MQGKEASEQETKAKSNVGIDVSKDWLDVHVLPAGERRRVRNIGEGIRQLKRWLAGLDLALVVIEATGHAPGAMTGVRFRSRTTFRSLWYRAKTVEVTMT